MKTKKTGKTMRVAGLLLALVLVTSCFVGGTFAKYVTSDHKVDSARAAKWGVVVDVEGDSAFAKQYDGDENAQGNTVIAAATATYKVVAPGTKKDNVLSSTLTGTPEVKVEVTYDATVVLANWEDAQHKYYCPLVFTIKHGGTTTTLSGMKYDSVTDFQTALETEIKSVKATYAPNTDLSTATGHDLSISWEWPFETGTTENEKAANNVKDTYLGDQAAVPAGTKVPNIHFGIFTTVTQVD